MASALAKTVVLGASYGEFASDIAAVHPTKRVTLLHSRARLLPRFDGGGEGGDGEGEESGGMHAEILQALHALNVHVVLGERVDLASLSSLAPSSSDAEARADDTTTAGQRSVRTTTGRQIDADLVLLCTGQTPNTALLRALDPRVVDPASGLARVGRGMQLAIPLSSPRGFSSPAFDVRGAPNVEGATAARRRGSVREECAEDGRGEAREKEPAGRSTEEEEDEECAHSSTLPTRTNEGGDGRRIEEAIEDAQDDDASVLAAALAEIDLLDAASGSSFLHRDHANELDNLKEAESSPSPSSAPSPASPSHSLVSEVDKQAADADPAANDNEDTTFHNDEEEPTPTPTPYPHIFAIGDAADAFGALPAGHNA